MQNAVEVDTQRQSEKKGDHRLPGYMRGEIEVDAQRQQEVKEQQCPECQAAIPVHFGYVTWCDQCGWNLQPQEPSRPLNVFESLYASMGERLSQGLFDELVKAASLKPTLTLSKVMAFSFAAIVHGITLVFAILGVVLLVNEWLNPLAIFGLLCLGIAWFLRPRLPKLPDEILPRDKFPTLYKIADDVAQALGTSNVDGIIVDWRFGAAFSQVGWRRKRVLYLGLPLFSILDAQEKVALLAHELAHGVNGDPIRGFFIGSAIDSLITWSDLLRRMFGLSIIAWLGAYALSHLLWRDSQRAEYLADFLAANVSGTDAMLSALEKLHFERTFVLIAQRVSRSRSIQHLFDELWRHVVEVPQRELERIRRVNQLRASRLDATHPPTIYRVEFLKAHRVSEPKVVLSPSDLEQLEQELASVQGRIQRKVLDIYR